MRLLTYVKHTPMLSLKVETGKQEQFHAMMTSSSHPNTVENNCANKCSWKTSASVQAPLQKHHVIQGGHKTPEAYAVNTVLFSRLSSHIGARMSGGLSRVLSGVQLLLAQTNCILAGSYSAA